MLEQASYVVRIFQRGERRHVVSASIYSVSVAIYQCIVATQTEDSFHVESWEE